MPFKASSQDISTAIGSYLLHIASGIATIWGSTNIYYLSYFYYLDHSINASTNSIILISVVIPLSIILVLSTKLSDSLGYTKTIRYCALCFFVSQIVIYIKFSLVLFVIFSLLIPVACITVALIPTLNLLWSRFSQKKSICTAVNLVFLGLGTILWSILFVALVNPDNQEAEIDVNGNPYFSLEIALRIQDATKIIMFVCSLLFVTGAYMVKSSDVHEQKPQNVIKPQAETEMKEEGHNQENKDKEKQHTCERTILVNKGSQDIIEQCKQSQISPQKAQRQNSQQELPLLSALKDQRCYLIFLLLVVIDIYPVYLLNNFKVIFMPIFNDDHFLAACITINTVSNILGTFLWGYLAHRLGNITTVSIVVSFTLLGGIIGFFSRNHITIIIFMIIFGVGDRGMETIAGPALVQIFGLRTATLLLPYKGLSLIIGFLMAPVFQLITAKYFNSFQQLGFLFTFCIISFLIGVYYTSKFRQVDAKSLHEQQAKNKDAVVAGNEYEHFEDMHVETKTQG